MQNSTNMQDSTNKGAIIDMDIPHFPENCSKEDKLKIWADFYTDKSKNEEHGDNNYYNEFY
jgi:hypothetical protein